MDDFEMEELDHVSELYDKIDHLHAKTEELSKALDAMTAERDAALEANASVKVRALEDAATVADRYHKEATEWAKGLWGLEKFSDGDTDSSRIAAAIRAMKEPKP